MIFSAGTRDWIDILGYNDRMDFPRLSTKQRLASAALIAAGLAALWFSLPQRRWESFRPSVILLALGLASIAGGVAMLIAKRGRLTVVGAILAGAIVGALACVSIARAMHPELRPSAELVANENLMDRVEMVQNLGMILGASAAAAIAAAWSAQKERSD
jgi:hypothetical protein